MSNPMWNNTYRNKVIHNIISQLNEAFNPILFFEDEKNKHIPYRSIQTFTIKNILGESREITLNSNLFEDLPMLKFLIKDKMVKLLYGL